MPIPCEYWKGSCPIEGYIACTEGCRTDGITGWADEDATSLCKGSSSGPFVEGSVPETVEIQEPAAEVLEFHDAQPTP
jgi:hypothetical protein